MLASDILCRVAHGLNTDTHMSTIVHTGCDTRRLGTRAYRPKPLPVAVETPLLEYREAGVLFSSQGVGVCAYTGREPFGTRIDSPRPDLRQARLSVG